DNSWTDFSSRNSVLHLSDEHFINIFFSRPEHLTKLKIWRSTFSFIIESSGTNNLQAGDFLHLFQHLRASLTVIWSRIYQRLHSLFHNIPYRCNSILTTSLVIQSY